MPTVVKEDGLSVKVHVSNEHPPPHVHVWGSDWEIRVLIGEAAELWDVVYGSPNGKQATRAVELVAKYLERCNDAWRAYHG